MSSELTLPVLWSPLGFACTMALALVLYVAPAPRRPLPLKCPLACFGAAAVMVATAIAMCAIWGVWQAGGVLLMCALTLAVVGFWLGQAPLASELAGSRRDVDRAIAADGEARRLATDAPPRQLSTLTIDWDAFDRVREQWSR